jgi:hypothetical protein
MNVEIWTEAAQFPEKEYINAIFVAVRLLTTMRTRILLFTMDPDPDSQNDAYPCGTRQSYVATSKNY